MRKPVRRAEITRTSRNDKRRLCAVIPNEEYLDELVARVRYGGSSKHKLNPPAFGLEPHRGPRKDATYCDAHAHFTPDDMKFALSWLKRGIKAGLLGYNNTLGDPTMIWAPGNDGWIYEARITVPGQALYHGYPVLPTEAIVEPVLLRYQTWAEGQHDNADVWRSVERLQTRYR